MRRSSKTAAVIAAVSLAIGACGGSDDDAADTADSVDADDDSADDDGADSADDTGSSQPTDDEGTVGSDVSAPGSEPSEPADSADAEPFGTVRFAHFLHPDGWDPHLETRAYAMAYFGPVYDGLVNEDPGGTLVPGLATEWEQTSTELRFTLREGVTFHDGTPFDADAVAYNIELVQGMPGANSAFLSTISEVEVVSPTEVVFHLSERDGDLLASLARMAGMMISPSVSPADVQAGVPAGTGPYQVAEFVEGRTLLELNPNFWDASQQGVEEIEFHELLDDSARINALLTGEVNVAALRSVQVGTAESEGFEIAVTPVQRIPHLQIMDVTGTQNAALGDQRVREAIFHAIDKEAFNEAVFSGMAEPADQYYGPDTPWHLDDLEPYEYDPERSRELLAEAGAEGLVIEGTTWGGFALGDQVLQQMLADVGITYNLTQVAPGGDTASRAAGEREIEFTFMSSNHPQTMFDNYFNPASGRYPFGGYGPGAEDALEMLASAENSEDELAAQRELLRVVHEGAWGLPLVSEPGFTAHADNIENVVGQNYVGNGIDLRRVRITD